MRLFSAPRSRPTSPAPQATFAASKYSRMSQSSSGDGKSTDRRSCEDDDDDNPTPSPATPRKTPSTPSFSIGLADKGDAIGMGQPPGSSGGDRRSFSGPSASPNDSSLPARKRGLAQLMERVSTDADEISKKLNRKPPPPPPGRKPYAYLLLE